MQDVADRDFVTYLQTTDAQQASWAELQQLSAASVASVAIGTALRPADYRAIRAALAVHVVAESGR